MAVSENPADNQTKQPTMVPGVIANRWQGAVVVFKSIMSRPAGMIGTFLVFGHLLLAVFASVISPYDVALQSADDILQAPSAAHWMGTDSLGRDVFSRTISGGQLSILITLISSIIAAIWGGLVGVSLGLLGGKIDDFAMRLVDAFLAIPGLLFLLLIVSFTGGGLFALIPTLSFFNGISVIRIGRGAAQSVAAKDYITAARIRGHSSKFIIFKEMMPNLRHILLVEWAMRWSWMMLAFSSLSFLGFGATPPTPDWGLMISDSREFMTIAPWAGVWPAVFLSSLIIGINLFADALSKALCVDRDQIGVI